MSHLAALRDQINGLHLADEKAVLTTLTKAHGLTKPARERISQAAADLVRQIRCAGDIGLMEVFLAEYGLSSDEGVALMCLAEALLRVPDAQTIDDLIEDKIAPSAWGKHLGQSSSSLVNASTWALMLTGKVLKEGTSHGLAETLHNAVRRVGEPIIRVAVTRAIKEMGHQFVLGRDLQEAVKRGEGQEEKGFTYSYDMLGEAALTAKDAQGFYQSYTDAIRFLSLRAQSKDIRENPGISIKLSALHPRYEVGQHERVMSELVPRVKALALMTKEGGLGLNIDAEEADRLDLSLDVIEAVLRSGEFAGWDGFGVVVQAYSKRASAVIDWLYALAKSCDVRIMVRLVKGAYWDTEIKQAQVDGVADFPVFTHKAATDISYLCCARKLLDYRDWIYPQFATHNAHSVCAIMDMADNAQSYEFQRLHGMGEALYNLVLKDKKVRCRIYAPVGAHRDLLAYLVRRLLENGANSSFVNQLVDEEVSPETIAADPFDFMDHGLDEKQSSGDHLVVKPPLLYWPERKNSTGWDLRDYGDVEKFEQARGKFKSRQWDVKPLIASKALSGEQHDIINPAKPDDRVGCVFMVSIEQVDDALKAARSWDDTTPQDRHDILNKAADLFEENAGEMFAILCREAGKTGIDAVSEIREAVDFLRYYGAQALVLGDLPARGIITCISPWNFPLAIFSGQIGAALAAGNGVLAKPAEPTPIIAFKAVSLMHEAGVPLAVLQLIVGKGSIVGVKLTSDVRVNGICFTGSTGVAQLIYRASAGALEPDSTFIAETGGLNAMIVDSTALAEQAVQDVVDSAFRSCGQRCSALRMLYVQKDIADYFLEMLYGAMDELQVGDPWQLSSDVGPVITQTARQEIGDYVERARRGGALLKQIEVPDTGLFIGPAVIKVAGIDDLEKEIFGPVLHIATFEADEVDDIVSDINRRGYGLTFGLHTRIDDRVEQITSRLNVGNIYVNRNQIGAVVGSQPFGGEGLSGTGPKAGGPLYVKRFKRFEMPRHSVAGEPDGVSDRGVDIARIQAMLDEAKTDTHRALDTRDLPGLTGESNRWSVYARGVILCLGPTIKDAQQQMSIARQAGCACVAVVPEIEGENCIDGFLPRAALTTLNGFDGVALWSVADDLMMARQALAKRDGALIGLMVTTAMYDLCLVERHLCIDITAAGGNASLLAAQ